MDIQLHDTYVVLGWWAWLPIGLAGLLLIVLIWTARAGLKRTYFPLLVTVLTLLVSLSGWVSIATILSTSLVSPPVTNASGNELVVDARSRWLLDNLGWFVIAGQVLMAGFVVLLNQRAHRAWQR